MNLAPTSCTSFQLSIIISALKISSLVVETDAQRAAKQCDKTKGMLEALRKHEKGVNDSLGSWGHH